MGPDQGGWIFLKGGMRLSPLPLPREHSCHEEPQCEAASKLWLGKFSVKGQITNFKILRSRWSPSRLLSSVVIDSIVTDSI